MNKEKLDINHPRSILGFSLHKTQEEIRKALKSEECGNNYSDWAYARWTSHSIDYKKAVDYETNAHDKVGGSYKTWALWHNAVLAAKSWFDVYPALKIAAKTNVENTAVVEIPTMPSVDIAPLYGILAVPFSSVKEEIVKYALHNSSNHVFNHKDKTLNMDYKLAYEYENLHSDEGSYSTWKSWAESIRNKNSWFEVYPHLVGYDDPFHLAKKNITVRQIATNSAERFKIALEKWFADTEKDRITFVKESKTDFTVEYPATFVGDDPPQNITRKEFEQAKLWINKYSGKLFDMENRRVEEVLLNSGPKSTHKTPDFVKKAARFYKNHKKENSNYCWWDTFFDILEKDAWGTIFGFSDRTLEKEKIYTIDLQLVKNWIEHNDLKNLTENQLFHFLSGNYLAVAFESAYKYAKKFRRFKYYTEWIAAIMAAKTWDDVYPWIKGGKAKKPDQANFDETKKWLKSQIAVFNNEPEQIRENEFYQFCHTVYYKNQRVIDAVKYEAQKNKFPTWHSWVKRIFAVKSWDEVYGEIKTVCIEGADFAAVKNMLGNLEDWEPEDIATEFNDDYLEEYRNAVKYELSKGYFISWKSWRKAIRDSKNWTQVYSMTQDY